MIERTRLPIVAALLAMMAFAGLAFAATQPNYIRESANAGMLREDKAIFSGHLITIPAVAVALGAADTTFEIQGRDVCAMPGIALHGMHDKLIVRKAGR